MRKKVFPNEEDGFTSDQYTEIVGGTSAKNIGYTDPWQVW